MTITRSHPPTRTHKHTAVPCSANALRLNTGGKTTAGNSTFGRLEVCVGGAYGTVSSVGFDETQAAAVCRQLGFQDYGKHLYHKSFQFP